MKNGTRSMFLAFVFTAMTGLASGCGDKGTNEGETTNNTTNTENTTTNGQTNETIDTSGQLRAFGESCENDDQCDGGAVCTQFDTLGMVCTFSCSDPGTCPEGSKGQKCNQSGYCRP